MTVTEKIAAYREALADRVQGELRMALTDAEALTLIAERGVTAFPRASELADAAPVFADLVKNTPTADTDPDVIAEWATKYQRARSKFWDGLSCTEFDGVVIVRKQA